MNVAAAMSGEAPKTRREWIYRHPLPVRATHWVNVLCVLLLLASGLQIFNAHPALYWGEASRFDSPWLSLTAAQIDGRPVGLTTVAGLRLETTGFLGLSQEEGRLRERGFPAWATLPSWQDLATGRRWHFFFAWLFLANGAAYLAYALASGRLWHELWPSLGDVRALGRTILDHLRLRLPRNHAARHYNPLQRISYLVVVLILLPVLIVAGLAMSPGFNAAFPWLTDLFGGRQSARSAHFIAAFLLTLFVVAHVLMVLLSGAINSLRSMITGRYRIKLEGRAP